MRRLIGPPGVARRRLLMLTLPRERALRKRFQTEFNRVARLAAGNLIAGRPVESGLSTHFDTVRRLLESSYREGMPKYGQLITDAAAKKAPAADEFDKLVQQWIRVNGARKVTQISSTTEKQLKKIIADGTVQGLGSRVIAGTINDSFASIGPARALSIAITETHTAANAAQLFAAESTHIDMKREWIAADDERTREDHAEADGQVVGIDQPFSVGGEALMYPGDPGGSPEQIVNCRCAQGFIVQ